MQLFEAQDYREYVRLRVRSLPKNGYGQLKRIAEHLNISTVLVSQIFKGDRDLTVDQAYAITQYFNMSDIEARYFVTLVQRDRSGNRDYKNFLSGELARLREESQNLKARLPQDKELSEEEKAAFYSDWIYSGVRLASSIFSVMRH